MVGASRRRCFIVLNGRSTRGQASRFCGWTDPPLSANGRQVVLGLRQRLTDTSTRVPKIWYVSDRRRAVETFEVLTAGMHAPVVRISDRLREINFGDYENLTWEELPPDFQRHYEVCQRAPMDLRFPGGESFRELCERVSSHALEILSYEEDDSDVGIVGHQGSMRLWIMMAEGLPPEAFFDATPELGEGRWLDIGPGHVAAWRRKHLDPPGGSQ
jgi:broad specificity phosphatase PhoE